jgi:hypothetical protein
MSACKMWMLDRVFRSGSSDTFLSVSALLRTSPMTRLSGSLEYWRRNSYWKTRLSTYPRKSTVMVPTPRPLETPVMTYEGILCQELLFCCCLLLFSASAEVLN